MTITIKKFHLAIAVIAVALIVPATAVATHLGTHTHFFDDVPDDAFFADAATWAKANNITTGSPAGSTTFKPLDPVTRGESVTFAKRYDDNIVQPALTSMTAAQPFAATAFEGSTVDLTDTPTAYVTVSVTAPVAGHVTVNSTANVFHNLPGGDVYCVIVEGTDIPSGNITDFAESVQWHENSGQNGGSLSGTRTFAIAAGATIDYVLACEELQNGGTINARNLTAIFTPAP